MIKKSIMITVLEGAEVTQVNWAYRYSGDERVCLAFTGDVHELARVFVGLGRFHGELVASAFSVDWEEAVTLTGGIDELTATLTRYRTPTGEPLWYFPGVEVVDDGLRSSSNAPHYAVGSSQLVSPTSPSASELDGDNTRSGATNASTSVDELLETLAVLTGDPWRVDPPPLVSDGNVDDWESPAVEHHVADELLTRGDPDAEHDRRGDR